MNRAERRALWQANHRQSNRRSAPAREARASAPVHLHIEELMLHGLPGFQRYAVGVALQQELTALLTDRGLPPALLQSVDERRADAGPLSAAPRPGVSGLGAQIARAVYGGPPHG